MSKKLILLAAGALSALALASFPAGASAGEFIGHCSSGGVCNATFSAGQSELEDDGGLKISCTSTTGVVTGTSGTSTGTAVLKAHGCKETIFNTSCTSSGQPAGTLHTGAGIVSHLIYIDPKPSTLVGLLVTNINFTFSCAGGLIQKTVTGSVIAKIENPECGKPRTSFTGEFTKVGTGSQQYKQITTQGTVFDLLVGAHASDTTTAAIVGTGTITVAEGKTVTLTC